MVKKQLEDCVCVYVRNGKSSVCIYEGMDSDYDSIFLES